MTKVITSLGFHEVCAVTVTKLRKYTRHSDGQDFYSNEIVLTDADGNDLRINIFGDIEYPVKVVED